MPDEDDLVKAWELIKAAERPLIIIGKGAAYAFGPSELRPSFRSLAHMPQYTDKCRRYARAEPELREMVDVTGLPFLSSPMGKGVVPDDHPLNVGAARSLALSKAGALL